VTVTPFSAPMTGIKGNLNVCQAMPGHGALVLRKAIAFARGGTGGKASKRGATFKVGYVYYCTVILVLAGLVLFAIRLAGQRRLQERQMKLAERARKRRKRKAQDAKSPAQPLPHQRVVLRRQLKNVPTPWGWPGSANRPAGGEGHSAMPRGIQLAPSGLMQRWIDHLMAEKRTVEDEEYRESRQAALRSMIEDRFGRSPQPQEMAYRKVRPPKLMDPDRPHDQMDNFPSGKTEHIVSGLKRQPGDTRRGQSTPVTRKAARLDDIKTPWGW